MIIVPHTNKTWSIGFVHNGDFVKLVRNADSREEALRLYVERGYDLSKITNLNEQLAN